MASRQLGESAVIRSLRRFRDAYFPNSGKVVKDVLTPDGDKRAEAERPQPGYFDSLPVRKSAVQFCIVWRVAPLLSPVNNAVEILQVYYKSSKYTVVILLITLPSLAERWTSNFWSWPSCLLLTSVVWEPRAATGGRWFETLYCGGTSYSGICRTGHLLTTWPCLSSTLLWSTTTRGWMTAMRGTIKGWNQNLTSCQSECVWCWSLRGLDCIIIDPLFLFFCFKKCFSFSTDTWKAVLPADSSGFLPGLPTRSWPHFFCLWCPHPSLVTPCSAPAWSSWTCPSSRG